MYRRKQKRIFRNISKSKRAIYWANEAIDVPLEQDEVAQWWGLSATGTGPTTPATSNSATYTLLRRIWRESGSSEGRSACGPSSAISAHFSRRFGFAAACLLNGFEIVRFRA